MLARGLFAGVALLTAACGDKVERVCKVEGAVTYAEVAAVFEEHCLRCHDSSRAGGDRNGAPSDVNFDTYQLAKEHARGANAQLLTGRMPADAPDSVPDEQACLIEAWIEQGFPQ